MLLLPARNSRFADAGDAVRRGFLAARQVAGEALAVEVDETDESAPQLLAALASARDRGARIAVGPLSRDAVNAVVDGNRALLPLVTLNYPERDTLPPALLAFGLSLEQEARQVARAALGEGALPDADAAQVAHSARPALRLLVVGGSAPLERRMTEAFRLALVELGERALIIEPALDPAGIDDFAERIKGQDYDAVFLALNLHGATLLRSRFPRNARLWATSQVNPGADVARALAPDLAGIRFVDMPWLLDPTQAAVMIYPRPRPDDGVPIGIDFERLYALGIDAYRLATTWMTGRSRFEVDGVTGALQVDRERSARVERFASFAVFRNGRIERDDPAR